jgi:hypothetical protein
MVGDALAAGGIGGIELARVDVEQGATPDVEIGVACPRDRGQRTAERDVPSRLWGRPTRATRRHERADHHTDTVWCPRHALSMRAVRASSRRAERQPRPKVLLEVDLTPTAGLPSPAARLRALARRRWRGRLVVTSQATARACRGRS